MLTKTANVFNYLGTRAKLGFTPKAAIRLPPECSPAYNLSRILARRRDPGCASPLQKSKLNGLQKKVLRLLGMRPQAYRISMG
ncbi:MAG: hypothetical protein DMG98_28640 [Acidobacteria bacterium]|nr:MAG: hypothetical protein DMG98_28640 [Acidobacteriota bacterium]